MEFEEMKKIWDSQNQEPIYGINEKAMHNLIQNKKRQVYHITHFSEWLSILVNLSGGVFILVMNFYGKHTSIFLYCLSAWMFGVGVYSWVSRMRRIRGENKFDRSMLGDLRYAVAMATYQVHFSQIMRWNILPVGLLIILGIWENTKSIWMAVGILIFFILTNYFSGWEHNFYKGKKRELEVLQSKLENEDGAAEGR